MEPIISGNCNFFPKPAPVGLAFSRSKSTTDIKGNTMYFDRVYTRAFISHLCNKYPEGTRIELIGLYDPSRADLAYGDRGTVAYIDNMANISVCWDKGFTCDLIYDDDIFRVID